MSKETFTPASMTISKLFNVEKPYSIPDYQRPYMWSSEQLEQLYEDIYEAFINREINDYYFLGSIVVVETRTKELVIDGQQRLTTLMIALNVLRANFQNMNKDASDDSDELHVYDHTIKNRIFIDGGVESKLSLQTFYKFDTDFQNKIIRKNDFSQIKNVTKKNLREDSSPKYKFDNTAKFFYEKFQELKESETENLLDQFIDFLFHKVYVIKITCYDQNFAIKLFQVLNDRGTPLNTSDIIKAHLMEKVTANGDENLNNILLSCWHKIETVTNENNANVDDFLVYFEYYKLASNPKTNVIQELKLIIEEAPSIREFITELETFADSLKKLYDSKNRDIYSLRYLPWKFYIITMITTAIMVEYENENKLYEKLKRYYYLCHVSGQNLNQVKQTSFNIIKAIKLKDSLEEIDNIIETSINERKMLSRAKENLEGDVYGEKFLKPLMATIEYGLTDTTQYIEIDKNLHIDHVLPLGYKKNPDDWKFENDELIDDNINSLGNLALLNYKKNISARNYGFDTKIRIYQGKDEDGNDIDGLTSFISTQKIIKSYNNGSVDWNLETIKEREIFLKNEIKKIIGDIF